MALKISALPGLIMDPETPGIYPGKLLYFRFSKCFFKVKDIDYVVNISFLISRRVIYLNYKI